MAADKSFCPTCGAPLKSGAAFCTACGAKVVQDGPQDVPAETTTESGSGVAAADLEDGLGSKPGRTTGVRSRKRRARLVIAFAIVAIACLGVGLGFASGAIPRLLSPTLTFGSDQAVAASRSALFVPKGEDGSPLVHYFVRVTSARDANGADIDVSSAEPLEVSSDQGFALDGVLGDLPDGTYYTEVVQDDGTVWEMPPVEVSDSEPTSTIEVEQGPDAPAPVNEADRLCLEKLQSYIDAYQLPSIVTMKPANEYEDYASYIQNLAYAQLVDFGDGKERLVLAYLDNPDQAHWAIKYGGGAGCYTIEVWGYDPRTGTLISQYKGYANGSISEGPLGSAVGNAFVDYTTDPDTGKLCLSVFNQQGDVGNLQQKFYAPGDDGSFEAVKDFNFVIEPMEPYEAFYIDDAQTDKNSFTSALNEWKVSNCYLLANSADSEDGARTNRQSKRSDGSVDSSVVKNVEETADTVQATRDELLARTGLSEEDLTADDTAEVSTSDSGLSKEEAAAFDDKLQELSDTYGGPSAHSNKVNDAQAEAYADGLCFARLVNFGDGKQRLVVVFNDSKGSSDGPYATDVFGQRYTLQVWEYDAGAQEVAIAWKGLASRTNGGYSIIGFYQSMDGKVYFETYDEKSQNLLLVGLDESGSLSQEDISLGSSWAFEEWYYLDNTGDTNEQALEDSGTTNGSTLLSHSVSECADTVTDTEFQLVSARS